MSARKSARQQFIELVEKNDANFRGDLSRDLGLARLALLAVQILQNDSPAAQAATSSALKQLTELADQASVAGCDESIERFVEHLQSDLGFRGNADNYYASDNSDLSLVLQRRSGIPITLAIIYIELGRALGFDLQGVSFPGHFLVAHYAAGASQNSTLPRTELTLIDPFAGQITDRPTCLANLARMQGNSAPGSEFSQEQQAIWFAPANSAQIGLRLLENLKQIFLQSKQMAKALSAVELQLLLAPGDAPLLAQQSALAAQLFGQETPPPVH